MSQKKVLVVDDDPDVRLFNTTVVEENGFIPIEATNGEEGLKKLKEEQPDLVILDVLMPRQSGIRLYRELKTDKAFKKVNVIMLSGIAQKTFLRSQKALTEFGVRKASDAWYGPRGILFLLFCRVPPSPEGFWVEKPPRVSVGSSVTLL